MKLVTIILLALLLLPSAAAKEGRITLLTVGEEGNLTTGGTADLYLDIRPGSGRVFIDSFPLTHIDTQISVRFAKEVACDYIKVNCNNLDFFYTIRSTSSVVGGPSAGAAMTLITIAKLSGLRLDEHAAITGTINSGGLIGPVSGIEQKAMAAKDKGITKVLVPKWSVVTFDEPSSFIINDDKISLPENETPNDTRTYKYADSLRVDGIDIIPVSTIEEALHEFTGMKQEQHDDSIEIPDSYQQIMGSIATQLCSRSDPLRDLLTARQRRDEDSVLNATDSNIASASSALEREDYYSAASFCFTANNALRSLVYKYEDNTTLLRTRDSLKKQADEFSMNISGEPIITISDLEAMMIVRERILEATTLLEQNDSNTYRNLGYIEERLLSAIAWSEFFRYDAGAGVELDESHLRGACINKLSEAEERINYLDTFLFEANDLSAELDGARGFYESGDYAFCLFKASKVKADANAIVGSIAITKEKLPELLQDKLYFARVQIAEQENFPIIGYSYYQYAESLRDKDPYLALVFSEYAAEFSNLDMYFPNTNYAKIMEFSATAYFYIGAFVGAIVTFGGLMLAYSLHKKKRR